MDREKHDPIGGDGWLPFVVKHHGRPIPTVEPFGHTATTILFPVPLNLRCAAAKKWPKKVTLRVVLKGVRL